eukprot:15334953-Ditylum_brightwellii.AAC.1
MKNQHPSSSSYYAEQQPPSKRRRLQTNQEAPMLCEDVLIHVTSFLPPRDLLRISTTCTALRNSITIPLVVKSAMIKGGHARRTMDELYALHKRGSIHPTSPLRLLRLANGKRCEFCFIKRANFVKPGYGVFCCSACCTIGDGNNAKDDDDDDEDTTPFKKDVLIETFRTKLGLAEWQHARIQTNEFTINNQGGRCRVWNKHLTSSSSSLGEAIGPLVTLQDLETMLGQQQQQQQDNQSSSIERDSQKNIDSYLSDVLKVPPMKVYEEYTKAYEDIKDRADNEKLEKQYNCLVRKKRVQNHPLYPLHHHHSTPSRNNNNNTATTTTSSTTSSTNTANNRRLEFNDAINYVTQVKLAFRNQPRGYLEFLNMIQKVRSREINMVGAIHTVSHLFRGHASLLLGFNAFLPDGFKIESPPPSPPPPLLSSSNSSPIVPPLPTTTTTTTTTPLLRRRDPEFNDAVNYVKQVKLAFRNDPRSYAQFLHTIHQVGNHEIDTVDVMYRVSNLFRGHNSLILGFNAFLPEGFKIELEEVLDDDDDDDDEVVMERNLYA